MSNTEYKLLAALRSEQNNHLVWKITPDLFTDSRMELFQAFRQAFEKYGNLSIDSIKHFYERELPDSIIVPLTLNDDYIDPLVDKLHQAHKQRLMEELGREYLASAKAGKLSERVQQLHDALQKPQEVDASLSSGISAFLSDFGSKVRGEYKYLSTGLPFLDAMVDGEYCRAEVTILTGASGGGKTALMGNSALAMAQKGFPILILSLEMPKAQLIARWVAQLAGIDGKVLRSGRETLTRGISPDKIERVNQALADIQNLPIHIIDRSDIDGAMAVGFIREFHKDYGVQCVFIDYLQIMNYEGDTKHYGLGHNVLMLKQVAKDLNIPVVLLAQRHSSDKRIYDTSDALKHCAVHVDIDMEPLSDDTDVRVTTLEFHKNRHGRLGKTTVLYNGATLSFVGNNESP